MAAHSGLERHAQGKLIGAEANEQGDDGQPSVLA
jgi:hypothetical protein